MIYLGHALISQMLAIPEIHAGMSSQKAKELGAASANVARHYSSTILSEKTQDWIKLIMVAGATYVPIAVAVGARKRAEATAKATPPKGMNVEGGFMRQGSIVESEMDGFEGQI
jgi:hypothetical protein